MAVPIYRGAGVYFLIKSGQVIYVGKSLNVGSRIGQHIREGRDFDATHIIPADGVNILTIEAMYIDKLQPCQNIAGIKKRIVA